MDSASGGFKVPVTSLGRKKKSGKDQTEESDSKPARSVDEAISDDVGACASVNSDPAASQSSNDRASQSSDNGSIDRGDTTQAQSSSRDESEIKGQKLSSSAIEDTPSLSDNTKSNDVDTGSSRAHKSRLSSQPGKSAESASNSGGEGSSPRVPYTVPHWSGNPPSNETFSLSVIKNGTIINEIDLIGKAYLVFGRLSSCDVQLEHPSISRYHAVLQYRPASQEKEGERESHTVSSTNPQEPGYYVYDLGSTHGTYLNKSRLDQRCYYRVRIGQMVKFGGSSRLFLLESSGADVQYEVEAEAEEERREITAQKEEYERRLAAAKEEEDRLAKERETAGVSWGIMMEDVPLDNGSGEEYEIDEEKEAYYKEDPKKALKKFFDREGLELEYEVEEEGPPKAMMYTVRVRLPIDTVSGEAVAEASVKGKKKDAVILCALNACRMLDAHDILRQPAKAHKRKKRNWEENDYYDSDEDTFLDRTGNIEQKRKKRMKKAGLLKEEAESYDTLQTKLSDTLQTIQVLERKLRKDSQSDDIGGTTDSLDAYMSSVGDHLDKTKRAEIKYQLHELRKDEERLRKLIDVAKPTSLPTTVERIAEQATITSQLETASKGKPMTALKSDKLSNKPVTSSVPSSPASCQDVISRNKEHSTSYNESADTCSSHRTGGVDQREEQSEMVSRAGTAHAHRSRKRKRHVIGPMMPPHPTTDQQGSTAQAKLESDPDYCDWLPPDYQTGDGKTHLNEKFGY